MAWVVGIMISVVVAQGEMRVVVEGVVVHTVLLRIDLNAARPYICSTDIQQCLGAVHGGSWYEICASISKTVTLAVFMVTTDNSNEITIQEEMLMQKCIVDDPILLDARLTTSAWLMVSWLTG